MSSAPQALLFDLGGVVIDIDFDRALEAWQPFSTLDLSGLRGAFRFDDAYARHERGEIDAATYFAHLRATLCLDADDDQIAAGWNAIYLGEIEETLVRVREIGKRLPCHAFTNTNAAHQTFWRTRFPGVVAAFDRIFASHEIGLRKPEPDAFRFVAAALALAPGDILFFDDLRENSEGARRAGLSAVHVRSPQDVHLALQAFR